MKITATIITLNEAGNIRDACDSVAWADEILVVDSESTDSTREIAAQSANRSFRGEPPALIRGGICSGLPNLQGCFEIARENKGIRAITGHARNDAGSGRRN